MKNSIYIIFPVLMLSLLSCAKESLNIEARENGIDLGMTRQSSIVDGQTFRVMVYSQDGLSYHSTGTYYYSSQSDRLIPCDVDDDGNVVLTDNAAYNPAKGAALPNGTYQMSVVSPAVAFSAETFNTFTVSRGEEFYATTPETVTINGYAIYELMNPLYDRRFLVEQVRFLRGADLDSGTTVEVSNLILANAGSTGLYHANTTSIEVEGDDPDMILRTPAGEEIIDEPNLLYVSESPLYVFAATYGRGDMNPNPLTLVFDLTMTEDIKVQTKTLRLPLFRDDEDALMDFEPSKKYKFKITVTTIFVSVTVEIYNGNAWETGSNGENDDVGGPAEIVDLGSWEIGSWESVNTPPEVIG